jgi:hypothetical protein
VGRRRSRRGCSRAHCLRVLHPPRIGARLHGPAGRSPCPHATRRQARTVAARNAALPAGRKASRSARGCIIHWKCWRPTP